MKPYVHAVSSANKFGGKLEDYLKIHDWFDQTKGHIGDNRHRAILHNSFGIFLAEQVFGHVIVNSEGKQVSVRDIGEQHVTEDLGAIPTISDYLSELPYKDWMHGKGTPPSYQKVAEYEKLNTPKKLEAPAATPNQPLILDDVVTFDGHSPLIDDGHGPVTRFPFPNTIVDGADGNCAKIPRPRKNPTLID